MAAEPIVYIVDDNFGERKALEAAVQAAGLRAAVFESADALIDFIKGDEYGCVLLDFRLKEMSGLQLLGHLWTRNSALMTIIVTGHGDIAAAVQCMKQGAVDFLEKPIENDVLLVKIEEALARSESVNLIRAQAKLGQNRLTALTGREQEILKMLVAGKSSKQIAVEAHLSLKTVSNHRAHLLAKTGAENTADLVRIAVVAQLVESREGESRKVPAGTNISRQRMHINRSGG